MDSVIMADYDRRSELKAFDDSKAGVKGLVDAGVARIPRIFIDDRVKLDDDHDKFQSVGDTKFSIPVIDLSGIDEDAALRGEIINKIGEACRKCGFFQVINHGIPMSVMDEMIEGVRRFHEQDTEVKKQFYSRNSTRGFHYYSNHDLYQALVANWRDSMGCVMATPPDPEALPAVCRNIMIEYSNYLKRLGLTLCELLSEALGLKSHCLKDVGYAEELYLLGHYYPECPQPELTLGTGSHTDGCFFTILLQDQIGGLQVLHENQWVDVPSLTGALVTNIGDLLRLNSNDKFKSVHHRVLARKVCPRISVAGFFSGVNASDLLGPIKDLLSEEHPPIYRQITRKDFLALLHKNGLEGTSSTLSNLRIDHKQTMGL